MDTVKTKAGEFEISQGVFGAESSPLSRPNKYKNEVEIENPRTGTTVRLKPSFEAALEIEDVLGSLEPIRIRLVTAGATPLGGVKLIELGVIIAAGARAAAKAAGTDPRQITRKGAEEFAYGMDRDALRKPISDFLYALTHGGQLRVDDLGNGASPSASLGDSSEAETAELMTEIGSRSEGYSG